MRSPRYVKARRVRRAVAVALAIEYGIRDAGYIAPKTARRAMKSRVEFEGLAKAIMFRKATTQIGGFASALWSVGKALARTGRVIGETLDDMAKTFAVARKIGETDEAFRERIKLMLSSP